MMEKTNKKTIEMKSEVLCQKEEFLQKADRMLSIIKNINRQGGITTQLQTAAACMELHYFDCYLQDTYIEKVIDRNDFPDLPKLEEYIRLFKDVGHDFFNDLYEEQHNPEQRDEDIKTISYLEVEVFDNNEQLRKYDEDNIDSWKELKTDIDMLSSLFNCLLKDVISELDSIYMEIRKQKAETSANVTSQKEREPRNNIREYIIDKERTEEIIEKLHRLIGNKINTAAADIIKEAMWIDLMVRPTIPSIKAEFLTIKCSPTPISNILKEGEKKPQKGGKVDTELLNKIREKFDQA